MKNTDLVFKNLMVSLSTTPGALKISLQRTQQKPRKLQGFSNVSQTFPKKKNRKDSVVIQRKEQEQKQVLNGTKSVLGFQRASAHLQSKVFLSNKDKYIKVAINLEFTSTDNTSAVTLGVESVQGVTQDRILCKIIQAIENNIPQNIKTTQQTVKKREQKNISTVSLHFPSRYNETESN